MGLLLTVKQAAERLNVRPSTVYALCAGRKLRHARLGVGRGAIRIDEADLQDYLRSATVRPDEQAAPEPAACGEATPPPKEVARFRHVRWSQLPDSPPDGVGRS